MQVYFHSWRLIPIRLCDGLSWGGSGWVEPVGEALVYRLVGDAQADCTRFQREMVEGQPRRELRCSDVTASEVKEYLRRAMNVSIDYEAEGDGPVADAYVECRVALHELKERKARRGRR